MLSDDIKKLELKFMKSREELIYEVRNRDWDINPDVLISLIKPAIIHLYYKTGEADVPLGESKVRGKPDLPVEMTWPTYNEMSMVFITQINFSDQYFRESDVNKVFPSVGMLYFFCYYEPPPSCYDFVPSKSEYTVIYRENLNDIARRDFPENLPDAYQFETSFQISFLLDWELPDWGDEHLIGQTLSAKDIDMLNELNNHGFPYRKLLGYPRPLQYSVSYDWASAYLHTYSNEFSLNEREELSRKFVNLFSFDMDQDGFDAISSSTAYFGIMEDDLKLQKFERSIFIMQDT
jgi:uncharacterized protein YwqG